jgi:rod shape-determining protein MreC
VPTDRSNEADYVRPVRRLVLGVLAVVLLALFLVWRIDSPRVERFRSAVIDTVVPNMDWAMAPITSTVRMFEDFRSYTRIYEQNQELRRELQQMRAWREAALQLEQRNAQLLDMVQVRLDPQLTHVTGVVMADAGSPYRQSVLINVGSRDGIVDGWAVMDGLGLAGRIAGVGERSSRVILLTDSNSRVPVLVQPTGQRALLSGDNSALPVLEFVESQDDLRPGDRVVSASDGGVFPPGLLVGEVVQANDGRLRVMLAADYGRIDFLRVLRSRPAEQIPPSETLLRPVDETGAPLDPASGLPLAPIDPSVTIAPSETELPAGVVAPVPPLPLPGGQPVSEDGNE